MDGFRKTFESPLFHLSPVQTIAHHFPTSSYIWSSNNAGEKKLQPALGTFKNILNHQNCNLFFDHNGKKNNTKSFRFDIEAVSKPQDSWVPIDIVHALQSREVLFARCEMCIRPRIKVTSTRFIVFINNLTTSPIMPSRFFAPPFHCPDLL